jgi:DNA-binding MarR family transcriptional regulator
MARKTKAEAAGIPEELRRRVLAEHGDWYGFRMILIGNYYSGELFATLQKRFGLLRDDFVILANLSDYGSMTANVICAMSGRPKNSISRGVIKLAGKGLIETEVDQADRRHVILTVTPEGRRLFEEVIVLFRNRERHMFGCLSSQEIAALDTILSKILDGWHRP